MIDTRTQQKLDQLKKQAEHNGWDYDEALDRAGLLLTQERGQRLVIQALENLLANLDNFSDTQIAGKDQTVTGAVVGCKNFIEMQIAMVGSQ